MGGINIGSQNAKTIINPKPDGVDYKKAAEKLAEIIQSEYVMKGQGDCLLECPFDDECEHLLQLKKEYYCERSDFADKLIQKLGGEDDA